MEDSTQDIQAAEVSKEQVEPTPAPALPFTTPQQPQQQVPPQAPEYAIGEIDRNDPIAVQYEQYAKELGIPPQSAAALYKWANEMAQKVKSEKGAESPVDIDTLNKQGITELQKMWGQNVEQNLRAAQNVFRRLPQEVADYIDRSGLGSNPLIVRAFYELSKGLEDRSIQRNEISPTDSAQSAKQKLADIMNDKKHPYHNRKASGHMDAVEYVHSLYKIIYGG